MKKYDIKHLPIKPLSEAAKETTVELDGVINVLGGRYFGPKTIVTYQNGDVIKYVIKGSLGENSIPNKSNAIKVEIGNTVTSIGLNAFYNCSKLISVIIPGNVTIIDYGAFMNCSGLTSVIISDGVTSIGMYTFYGCTNLSSITIPSSVTEIGAASFSLCLSLSTIKCLSKNAPISYKYPAGGAFGGSNKNYTGRNSYSTGNNVLKVPQGATGYDVPAWSDILLNSTKCGFHIEYI